MLCVDISFTMFTLSTICLESNSLHLFFFFWVGGGGGVVLGLIFCPSTDLKEKSV